LKVKLVTATLNPLLHLLALRALKLTNTTSTSLSKFLKTSVNQHAMKET
jgi:hypothetical protein